MRITNARTFLMHMQAFESPAKGLSHWAVKKIALFEAQTPSRFVPTVSFIAMRVLALAIPIFAFLDSLAFACVALFKAVLLRRSEAAFEIYQCGQALKLFFTSLGALPVGLFNPTILYQTKKNNLNRLAQQIEYKIHTTLKALTKPVSKIAMKEASTQLIGTLFGSSSISISRKIIDAIVDSLPDEHHEGFSVALDNARELIAQILARGYTKRISLSAIDAETLELLICIVDVRHPQMRLDLLEMSLDLIQHKPSLIRKWIETIDKKLKTLKQAIDCLFEIDNPKQRLDVLQKAITCLTNNQEPPAERKKLRALVDLIKGSAQEERDVDLLKKILGNLKSNPNLSQDELLRSIQKDKDSSIEGLRNIFALLALQMISSQTLLKTVLSKAARHQFRDKQKMISLLIVLFKLYQAPIKIEDKMEWLQRWSVLQTDREISDSLRIVRVFLSLIAPQIPKGNIEDPRIIVELFQKVFKRTDIFDESQLLNLRAPEALILFHSRLSDLHGTLKSSMLQASAHLFDMIVKGVFWQERHNEKNSPHLMRIFSSRPNLKEAWMRPCVKKIHNLVSGAGSHPYADYDVLETQDPSDILLASSDTNTCMHLEGRVFKMMGLIAFVKDGKYHNVVVKDKAGRICAEANLQLMWDDRNQKPVLFLDEISFKPAPEDRMLFFKAIRNLCKEKARALGLTLATLQDDRNILINRCSPEEVKDFPRYHGSVQALSCMAPVEYVSEFRKNVRTGVYSFSQTYVLQPEMLVV